MARVITFSRTFPAYHPKAGEPTYFVEKLLHSIYRNELPRIHQFDGIDRKEKAFILSMPPKHHTIRKGNRWKVGDKFSPRMWGDDVNPRSGRTGPYHSKQITIDSDIEVKKVWDIAYVNGIWDMPAAQCTTILEQIANNDGLTIEDFLAWFPKDFKGQIICWNENVNY